MDPILFHVDWAAVVVGAILAYFIGWLWYSRHLFGADWAVGVGLDTNSASASYGDAMVAQAFGTFLLSWVVGVAGAIDNYMLAILVAFAVAALMKARGFFMKNSRYAIAVDSGYVLVVVFVMVLIQVLL